MSPIPHSIPAHSRAALARDLPATAARAAMVAMCLSVGAQLVQAVGGSDGHVAFLRAAPGVGLLLSLLWVRVGRGRSPLRMLMWPEVVGSSLLLSLWLTVGERPTSSTATIVTVTIALAVALSALSIPFLSTVYGIVYQAQDRARMVAYGKIVTGVVSIVAAWSLGRLLAADPYAFRYAFPIVAGLGLILLVRFARMPVDVAHAPQPQRPLSALAVLRRDKAFRRFQLFQFLLGLSNLAAIPVIDLYVHRVLELPIDTAVLVVTHGVVMQATILLTVRYQSGLYDRLGVVRHRALTSALIGTSLVMWSFADSWQLAAVAAMLAGIGMSGGQIIWMIGSLAFAGKDELSTYAGIHTFLTGLRGVFAPAIGVWLINAELLPRGYRDFFLIAALLVFVSALGHARWVGQPGSR